MCVNLVAVSPSPTIANFMMLAVFALGEMIFLNFQVFGAPAPITVIRTKTTARAINDDFQLAGWQKREMSREGESGA